MSRSSRSRPGSVGDLDIPREPNEACEDELQPLATKPKQRLVQLSLPPQSPGRFSDISLIDPPRAPSLLAISSDFATNKLPSRLQPAQSSSSSTARPPQNPNSHSTPVSKPMPWRAPRSVAQAHRSHSESEIHVASGAHAVASNGLRTPEPQAQEKPGSRAEQAGLGSSMSAASSRLGPTKDSGLDGSESDVCSVLVGQSSFEGVGTSAYGKSEDMGDKGCTGDSPSKSRLHRILCGDLLLTTTVIGVLLGIGGGMLVRLAEPGPNAIEVLALPGDIMLRLLKMLVLPLVAGSMIAGVCSPRGSTMGMARVARYTLTYYAATTGISVVLGIVLVIAIQPGRGQPLNDTSAVGCAGREVQAAVPATPASSGAASALTALLGVAHTMFPDNVVRAAVDMNILGVITFALFFGLCLSQLGPEADGLVASIQAFNAVIARMVSTVLWVSPLGVASLIAAALCRSCNLGATAAALGLWVLVVALGLLVLGGLVLPGILAVATRGARSPLRSAAGFSRALALAFGTSSSSAALPAAMQCAQDMGCQESVTQFVLPLGTTVNMNGTALYEATTVLFIAQAHGVHMGLPELLVIAFTATLAAIGAAAIPSAGLVTMLMVLQAVNLDQYAGDIAMILAIDWLLDRCRTAINLLGDSYAVLVVDHLVRHHTSSQSGQPYSNLEMV